MGQLLGVVYPCFATHPIRKAGYKHKVSYMSAVTLIQRFGRALKLKVHFHMLLLGGVCVDRESRSCTRFRWVNAPTSAELARPGYTIAHLNGPTDYCHQCPLRRVALGF